MATDNSAADDSFSRSKITLLMILCGVVGAVSAGAASAAASDDAVPSITVKYDPRSLTTDAGAKAMYRRLLKAAVEVCPEVNYGSRLVSPAVQECRNQAVVRAVRQVNDPRLAAAADTSRVKKG